MDEGQEALGGLVVARRHRPELLEPVHQALDAIASGWVEDEVTKAFEEERRRDQIVLFPIRLDDAVLTTAKAWAAKLRASRNIGDFRRWKEHDAYRTALERLLRDLKVDTSPTPDG